MAQPENKFSVYPLYEGTFSVGLDKKFKRIGRDDQPEKGALKISINPFLIKGEKRNILFDAGLGEFGEDTTTETIRNNMEEFGLSEHDITDIFCSHLHYDHIGGLAGTSSGYWELTFPDARIWVSRGGWRKVMNQDSYFDDEKTEFIHFVNARGNLQFLDEEESPYPEITVRKIGGHTEYSQLLTFNDGTRKYMMAGDVLATRGEVNRKFAAKYDFDPKKSMEIRRNITKLAHEENCIFMGYHDSHSPLFRLTGYDEEQGYRIESISDHVTA